jgi:FixJ family two-component response regulator
LGATDFIGKPYGEKDLMLKVDQLLASVYDQIAEEQA